MRHIQKNHGGTMILPKILLWLLLLFTVSTAVADEDRGEIRGLKLGMQAATMTTTGFADFACGSGGGPLGARLSGWTDFRSCQPDANGLHEVEFAFDNLESGEAKAYGHLSFSSESEGTRIAGHPVILSVLFNDAGVVEGIRIITDPHASLFKRRMAQLLRLSVMTHYGENGWTCVDEPPAPGEIPVGKIFIKQHCDKTTPEHHLVMQARLLRKPGQSEDEAGQFESSTRLEIWDPTLKVE
jgi:hypothetical protein